MESSIFGMVVSVIISLALLIVVFFRHLFCGPGDRRRSEALAAFALANGLSHTAEFKTFTREDWMNFYLFLAEHGTGPRFLNQVRGQVNGRYWVFFDFTIRLPGLPIRMNWSPRNFTGGALTFCSYFRDFTGGVVALNGKTLPAFVMSRRTPWLGSDPPEAAHLQRRSFPAKNDIRFGDDAFEAKYNVQGRDPEAIRGLFHPELRRDLLADSRDWCVEGSGEYLAVYYYVQASPCPPEKDFADIGRVVKNFDAAA